MYSTALYKLEIHLINGEVIESFYDDEERAKRFRDSVVKKDESNFEKTEREKSFVFKWEDVSPRECPNQLHINLDKILYVRLAKIYANT